jgi:MFS family permease
MSLTLSGLNATLWLQAASVAGVLIGGWLADHWTGRRRGGRMLVQAIGLFAGAPLIFVTGWTLSVPVLVLALAGFGLFKGFYDANIWAALYDFVPPSRRATAMGFMNAIGWFGGGTAPVLIALASERFGMNSALSATSLIYVLFGTLLVLGISATATTKPHTLKDEKT